MKKTLKQYWKCLVDYYSVEGVIYGFPLQLKVGCLAYNKDIFDKEGLPYPPPDWTWDEYYETAKKLTKDTDGDGRVDQWGSNLGDLPIWILSNGGGVVDLVGDDPSKEG